VLSGVCWRESGAGILTESRRSIRGSIRRRIGYGINRVQGSQAPNPIRLGPWRVRGHIGGRLGQQFRTPVCSRCDDEYVCQDSGLGVKPRVDVQYRLQ
jgi:hypothetical protein